MISDIDPELDLDLDIDRDLDVAVVKFENSTVTLNSAGEIDADPHSRKRKICSLDEDLTSEDQEKLFKQQDSSGASFTRSAFKDSEHRSNKIENKTMENSADNVSVSVYELKLNPDSEQISSSLDHAKSKGMNIVKNNDDAEAQSDEEDARTYMQIRESNLKANQEFLARIGIHKAKEDFESSVRPTLKKVESTVAKEKIEPTQRKLKQKKIEEHIPRRQSLRIRRLDPNGKPLPEPEPVKQPNVDPKRSEKQQDKDIEYLIDMIVSLQKKEQLDYVTSDSVEHDDLVSDIRNIKITTEDHIAKVVPGFIRSVAWHPSKTCLLAIAGDADGSVGLWNVSASDDDRRKVKSTVLEIHSDAVTHIYVPPTDLQKMYTSSFDSRLKCLDFEKGIDVVYSFPERRKDHFRHFDFISNSSSMLVSHSSGLVSLVDTCTASVEKIFRVSQFAVRKVSVHPVFTNYFLSAGSDREIKLWDLRSMNAESAIPKPVQILASHSATISSACFSPTSGNQILSSSSDDTIKIHSASEGMKFELTTTIQHKNHVGLNRLPYFQSTWHPTAEGIFVTGSMAHPRRIKVFNSNGRIIKNLQGDNFTSVCKLNVFHPTRPECLLGASYSGLLHVFK